MRGVFASTLVACGLFVVPAALASSEEARTYPAGGSWRIVLTRDADDRPACSAATDGTPVSVEIIVPAGAAPSVGVYYPPGPLVSSRSAVLAVDGREIAHLAIGDRGKAPDGVNGFYVPLTETLLMRRLLPALQHGSELDVTFFTREQGKRDLRVRVGEFRDNAQSLQQCIGDLSGGGIAPDRAEPERQPAPTVTNALAHDPPRSPGAP